MLFDVTLPLIAPAVELARAEGVTLVVETGNGTMVNSNYTARRLIDELDARYTERVGQIMGEFSDADLDTLKSLMDKIKRGLGYDEAS